VCGHRRIEASSRVKDFRDGQAEAKFAVRCVAVHGWRKVMIVTTILSLYP
jgi:hypothetical protein